MKCTCGLWDEILFAEIHNDRVLREFASQIHFPSHGLILRISKVEHTEIAKGFSAEKSLLNSFNFLIKKLGSVYAETDMRTMDNPMRMNVTEKAATQLIVKVKASCPQCQIPGFGDKTSKKDCLAHFVVCLPTQHWVLSIPANNAVSQKKKCIQIKKLLKIRCIVTTAIREKSCSEILWQYTSHSLI